jgi:trimeric autotransporter adhesin
VAGITGNSGFSGDGGLATNAHLHFAAGVAADVSGNIFIVDQQNDRIRRVNTNGIITTVAGSGSLGYSGDGGQATNAGLYLYQGSYLSYGMAVNPAGELFIADAGNHRIRKVDTNGIITTIAGTNSFGLSGDGGPAVNAQLFAPSGVAVDDFGNVFIADTSNNRIRKVDVTGVITTVAGTNISGFFSNGHNPGFSGDDGLAVNANLALPNGVAVDGSGNLFIADTGNNRIRKVDVNGIITTLAGSGQSYSESGSPLGSYSGDGGAATNATLNQPYGVTVDAYDDVFIADYSNNRIRVVGANGIIATVAGSGASSFSGDGGAATNAGIWQPSDVGMDTYGNLLIAGNASCSIRKVDLGEIPTLQLNNVGLTNVGNYAVVITSPYGSVTSSNATLTILFPPSIMTQPTSTKAFFGSSTEFIVSVSGTAPFGYQWFVSSARVATAVPFILGGSVFSVSITSGGSGYSSAPQVHFAGGSGNGASGTAAINQGTVTAINMTSPGFGYTLNPPTIQIDAPSPITSTSVLDQTNAMLTLAAISGGDATNYFVVVTNNYGSVTSTIVSLTVLLPPQNFFSQNTSSGLQMQLTGTPNYPYILQSATNLTTPISWKSILTNRADVNGNWQFTNTNLNEGQEFYRILGQ